MTAALGGLLIASLVVNVLQAFALREFLRASSRTCALARSVDELARKSGR